jgi:hypothetical protein
MSTSAFHPSAPASGIRGSRSFLRESLATTVSYLKWGYGALLLSTIGYASYAAFKTQEKVSNFPSKDSILPFLGFVFGSLLSALLGYWVGRAERKPRNISGQSLSSSKS